MRASHTERQEAYARKKEDLRLKEKTAESLTAEQQRKKEAREEKQRLKKRQPRLKVILKEFICNKVSPKFMRTQLLSAQE